MVEDLAAGKLNDPEDPSIEGAAALIEKRVSEGISYQQWQKIDAAEVSRGEVEGRPRVKFTRVADMVSVGKN
jgi:ferredoxin--NADP+ reductase